MGSGIVLTRHIFMTSFPAARKNVKVKSDIIMSSYPVNAPTCSGTALLKYIYIYITLTIKKYTRIPRNAVSRLPALFHKIEVNL